MKLSVSQEINPAEWDAYVESREEGTCYHLYDWKKVVEESFGHRGCYMAARDTDGRIRGILPLIHMKSLLFGNFLVSLPYFNYGGLLCDSSEAADALIAASREEMIRQGSRHVELRHIPDLIDHLPSRRHKVTMILDLEPTVSEQWNAFNAKLRNQIRKAQKSGLTVRIGGSELLDDFYGVFARNMRDLGTPVYDRRFFASILSAFPESTRIFAVQFEGRVVAAGYGIRFRDTLENPWASSLREYRNLCPNNLLYWEMIRHGIENGLRRFDFGRSTPGEGTFKFKEQWGAKPVQLNWHYLLSEGRELPDLSPKNRKFHLFIQLWKKLPLPVANWLGPKLVRGIP